MPGITHRACMAAFVSLTLLATGGCDVGSVDLDSLGSLIIDGQLPDDGTSDDASPDDASANDGDQATADDGDNDSSGGGETPDTLDDGDADDGAVPSDGEDPNADADADGDSPGDEATPDGGEPDDPDGGESPPDDATGQEDDVPDVAYCDTTLDWSGDWAAYEDEVLSLVNDERAAGAVCGGQPYAPAGPLAMNAELRCAARNHSMDMNLRDFFNHTNPDGLSPGDRVDLTGYAWSRWGENIAWGQTSPASVVQAWMNSPGHCANIMNSSFTEIGVGYYDGNFWTQVFAAPR